MSSSGRVPVRFLTPLQPSKSTGSSTVFQFESESESESESKYESECNDSDDAGLFAMATRDVAAGEELLFAYGTRWWLGRARLEARVILEELLARTRTISLDGSRAPRFARTIQVRRHTTLPIVTEA